MLRKVEAAAELGLSVRSVERLVAQRKLVVVSVTGTRGGKRIPASALAAYQAKICGEVQ